jgi:hypothetical protein
MVAREAGDWRKVAKLGKELDCTWFLSLHRITRRRVGSTKSPRRNGSHRGIDDLSHAHKNHANAASRYGIAPLPSRHRLFSTMEFSGMDEPRIVCEYPAPIRCHRCAEEFAQASAVSSITALSCTHIPQWRISTQLLAPWRPSGGGWSCSRMFPGEYYPHQGFAR